MMLSENGKVFFEDLCSVRLLVNEGIVWSQNGFLPLCSRRSL